MKKTQTARSSLLSEKERLLSYKAMHSMNISVSSFLLDHLFQVPKAQVSPDNSFWSGNKHLLSLIVGHFSHAKLD